MLAIPVMKQVVEGKPDFLVTLWLAAPNDKWGEVSGKIAQEWAMLDARAKLGGNGWDFLVKLWRRFETEGGEKWNVRKPPVNAPTYLSQQKSNC